LERINARLRAEGIPPVEMIILKWRVSQLLRDIQRKYGMYGRICHRNMCEPATRLQNVLQMYIS
jgi:hypothetical protein